MFYRYIIANEFEEPDFRPLDDVIRDSIMANDKGVLLHFLNEMGHDSPFAKKLNEMIDHDNGRWLRIGEGDKFFENEAAFEQFVSDLDKAYEEKTGLRFAGHLYSKDDCLELESESYDVDCHLDRFVPDADIDFSYDYRLSAFKEMPKPVPATQEEIDKAIANMEFDFTEVQYNLKLNPSDIQYILESEDPMKAFKDTIRNAYADDTDNLVHEQARGFHIELPVISEEDATQYALEKLDKELPFDYHMDTIKVDCVVYLKDTQRPVNLVGKEVSIQPGSSVEWLTNQIKPSAKVISAISSELNQFYDEDEFLVAFPIKKTMREIIEEKNNIKIPKGTRCGFFNPHTGDVGKFGIPITKDIEIPKDKAKLFVDGIYNTFALKDIFGKAIFDKPKQKSLYAAR